jgi:hypothetical protein
MVNGMMMMMITKGPVLAFHFSATSRVDYCHISLFRVGDDDDDDDDARFRTWNGRLTD